MKSLRDYLDLLELAGLTDTDVLTDTIQRYRENIAMMPKEESRENSIGIPWPDCYVKICKQGTTEECNYGEIGEICINGPTVMKEYVNNKKETEMVLKKHKDGKIWLHSGDAGHMDKENDCI